MVQEELVGAVVQRGEGRDIRTIRLDWTQQVMAGCFEQL